MKLFTIFFFIFFILFSVVWYLFAQKGDMQSLTVTAPSSGDVWQPGEEQMISWNTNNIPAEFNISITIERIPPPPLQEEGQEFDPIVFTNLPNTGSAVWKISPMYPNGTYVLRVNAYEAVPIMEAIVGTSKPFTIHHPEMNADVYPLYPVGGWQDTEAEEFAAGSIKNQGVSVTTASIYADMDPGSIFTPFEQYYKERLTRNGWEIANDLAAGGHTGGQTGYRKDGQIILTRFLINYQNKPDNAPSECPCDVTLSVFSADQN